MHDEREQERQIRCLEYLAQASPRVWKWRVGFWVALGYGVLALFPLSLLMLATTTVLWARQHDSSPVTWLCLVSLLAALGLSLSAFVVRLSPPPGIPVRPEDAPLLFETCVRLARALRMRPFTRVLLTPEGGAGVVELPRPWGGTISYLLIGLPLLEALSLEELEAVLVHELGHLRGGDSRFTRATVRLAAIWERLYGLSEDRRAFARFAGWYFPRLAVHTFAVRRHNERDADALAARTCGPETLARALCSVEGRLRYLEETFRAALETRAQAVPHPPERLFAAYLATLQAPLDQADMRRALCRALGEAQSPTDPHPALRERLGALGQSVLIPPPPEVSAAEALLGPCRERLTETLDALWRKQLVPAWRKTFTETRALKRERIQLDEQLAQGEWLDGALRLHHALLVERFDGAEAARPYLERLKLHPEVGADTLFALGRLDLEEGNPDGLWRVESALHRLPDRTDEGLRLIYNFHRQRGDARAAAETLRRRRVCERPISSYRAEGRVHRFGIGTQGLW
jgi:Zn-dependent protease with chaperone function